jgi:glutamate synthase (NADPH/NADH) large chain
VYDPSRSFPPNLNPEMVDLDPPDDDDIRWLQDIVGRHYVATRSTVAYRILADWYKEAEHFIKVMPKDYKRVLEATQFALERGESVDEAVMAASRG